MATPKAANFAGTVAARRLCPSKIRDHSGGNNSLQRRRLLAKTKSSAAKNCVVMQRVGIRGHVHSAAIQRKAVKNRCWQHLRKQISMIAIPNNGHKLTNGASNGDRDNVAVNGSTTTNFQKGEGPPKDKVAAQSEEALAESENSGDGSAAASTNTSESSSYTRDFLNARMVQFACILVGYSCYYLTRNSLTFAAPVMVADASLGLDITKIGVITSIFPICYGMSKFISGVLSTKLSARAMLGGGLLLTAVINVSFGFSSTMSAFVTLWALNGMLQGFGAPSCAKILTWWFATKERGTYWGMWNIAHNVGGFAAPVLAGTLARNFGWRAGLIGPGAIGLCVAALLIVFVRETPKDAGHAPVEQVDEKQKDQQQQRTKSEDKEEEEEDLSMIDNLRQNVLSNPRVWGLAITYFFVYIIRQGITSWSVFFLLDAKGVADAAVAAMRVAGLELGGLCGSLVAGKLSDWAIKTYPEAGATGMRIRVVIGYTFGIAAALAAFWAVPPSMGWLQPFIVFMIGFFLYGPQMLIGLCGAEIVGPKSVGASEGFLGWIAYLGAANAGVPLAMLVRKFGWDAFFLTLGSACVVAVCILSTLVNARSYVQRVQDAKA